MVEHTAENRGVAGSIPALGIIDTSLAPRYRRVRSGFGAGSCQPLDQAVHQLALQQHPVGSRFLDRLVQLRGIVARQRDQAEGRVLLPQMGNRRDAVDKRHVHIDHHRVGIKLVRLLDCLQAVLGETDDAQLGLAVDQLT